MYGLRTMAISAKLSAKLPECTNHQPLHTHTSIEIEIEIERHSLVIARGEAH